MLKKNLFSVIYVITEQKLPDLFLDINNKVIYYRGVDNKTAWQDFFAFFLQCATFFFDNLFYDCELEKRKNVT